MPPLYRPIAQWSLRVSVKDSTSLRRDSLIARRRKRHLWKREINSTPRRQRVALSIPATTPESLSASRLTADWTQFSRVPSLSAIEGSPSTPRFVVSCEHRHANSQHGDAGTSLRSAESCQTARFCPKAGIKIALCSQFRSYCARVCPNREQYCAFSCEVDCFMSSWPHSRNARPLRYRKSDT